jgi:hypothetical protein
MRTTSYLSSARVVSILLVLAMYLDIDLTRDQLQRNAWLNDARQIYARSFLGRLTKPLRNTREEVLGVGTVMIEQLHLPAGQERADGPVWVVKVTRVDGKQWRATIGEKTIGQSERELAERLQRIAATLGLKDTEKSDITALFRAIERDSAERKVTVPGVDLAFRPDIAPWVIAVLSLGFLLMVRNQLRRVLIDRDLALDEPWIVVDSGSGLERLVAAGWLLAIWAAPWITSGCLLAVFSSQIIVDGAVTTWPKELLACGASLLLICLGGWTSLTVTSDLLCLRRLRKQKLERLTSEPSAAAP